jgi:hypothetical protein
MSFDTINTNYAEYQFWLTLPNQNKLFYLFDLYTAESDKVNGKSMDLSGFFKSVHNELSESETDNNSNEWANIPDDQDRVDVMIDDNNIMIESNSLRAVRYVIFKFIESGYIIRRDIAVEKMFRKDKVTKYLRIFKIISQAPDICYN